MRALLILLPFAATLAGCNVENEPAKGTDLTIDATGKDGEKVSINADGETGKVGVNIPGLDAKIRLPKILLDDANFDIDGVKLYPGSTVKSVNISAKEGNGKHDNADVRMTFEAPADRATVNQWLKDQFAKKDMTLASDGNALSGSTKDGNRFTIELDEGAAGKTSGTIIIKG